MHRNPDEIGALWEKKSSQGVVYFTGKINDVKVVIFKNRDKKTDRHPDYRVLISKPKEQQSEPDQGF